MERSLVKKMGDCMPGKVIEYIHEGYAGVVERLTLVLVNAGGGVQKG